jgi:hypothetical protein
MLNLLIGLASVMDQLDLAKYHTHGCGARTRAARTGSSGQQNGERIFGKRILGRGNVAM